MKKSFDKIIKKNILHFAGFSLLLQIKMQKQKKEKCKREYLQGEILRVTKIGIVMSHWIKDLDEENWQSMSEQIAKNGISRELLTNYVPIEKRFPPIDTAFLEVPFGSCGWFQTLDSFSEKTLENLVGKLNVIFILDLYDVDPDNQNFEKYCSDLSEQEKQLILDMKNFILEKKDT